MLSCPIHKHLHTHCMYVVVVLHDSGNKTIAVQVALFDRIHNIRVKHIQEEYQKYMERVRSKAQSAIDLANTNYQTHRAMLTARVDAMVAYLQQQYLRVGNFIHPALVYALAMQRLLYQLYREIMLFSKIWLGMLAVAEAIANILARNKAMLLFSCISDACCSTGTWRSITGAAASSAAADAAGSATGSLS